MKLVLTPAVSKPPGQFFIGMFLELKRRTGKPSPEQLAYADRLRRAGYNCVICYGADEAIKAITAYCAS